MNSEYNTFGVLFMDYNNLIAYTKVHEFLLGRFPQSNNYNERIIAQKVGFLAQESGIYLGDMSYFWHKRGPYSRPLAAALRYFDMNREHFVVECSQIKIYDVIVPKLYLIKELIESGGSTCSQVTWLEICASLKFLSKEMNCYDIDYLCPLLLRKKPFLKPYKDDIYKSWDLMKKPVLV